MKVQALIPDLAVETFDKGVLHRLVRLDEAQTDTGWLGLVEHGLAGAHGPVVRDDLFRQTKSQCQLIKEPRNAHPGDRRESHSIY